MTTTAKDLTHEAPAAPSHRLGGYVILERLIDKARADFLGGNIGSYHTDCPLDHMLLDWKGIPYDDVKKLIVDGADNETIVKYVNDHGTPKSTEEVAAWSDGMDKANPAKNPEKREWFVGELGKLGLDPDDTTLFQWLEEDDRHL